MKAIVRDGYGPPDVLRLDEVQKPTPGAGEVLVRGLRCRVLGLVVTRITSLHRHCTGDRVGDKPANVSFEEAAAVPTAGLTALQERRILRRVRGAELTRSVFHRAAAILRVRCEITRSAALQGCPAAVQQA